MQVFIRAGDLQLTLFAVAATIATTLTSHVATAQSASEQAKQLAAPVVKSTYRNDTADQMLRELEQQESGTLAAPSPPPPEPSPTRAGDFVSHAVTTRFLFLKISDSLLRFQVDPNLGDDELDVVTRALSKSCLITAKSKSAPADATCTPGTRDAVVVDNAFFADAKLPQTKSSIWKLVCATGGDDCFDRKTKVRSFQLTTSRSVLSGRILAHGFESQPVRALAKKSRTPASAIPTKTFDRVYTTRTTREKIPQLPKGTL